MLKVRREMAFCHSAKLPRSSHLRIMKDAPFNIIIRGRNYECRVFGDTEGEAADAAETILLQLREEVKVFPSQVHIECADVEASKRLAAYLTDITVETDLG
jgi:hypothetical protein